MKLLWIYKKIGTIHLGDDMSMWQVKSPPISITKLKIGVKLSQIFRSIHSWYLSVARKIDHL